MTRQELAALVRGLAPVLKESLAFLHAKDRGLDGQVGPAGPEGKPGRDGQPGVPGRDGARGDRGADGANGRDGKDGAAGRDGTIENMKAVFDGDRTITLCLKDGTPIEGGVVKLATVLYRGVYQAGKSYERGDSVTFGGNAWIACEDTDAKPAEGKSWQLSVRSGRDGREGKQGPEGPKGRDGRDATPLGQR
ncbi:MAG: hypothetical protein ABI665_23715 [Vicinamibacterales bacterium]